MTQKPIHLFGKPLSGLKAHKWQRISALYLLVFFPYLAWHLSQNQVIQGIDIEAYLSNIFDPFFLLTSFIATSLILVHAWVGMRDIIIDYLPQQRVHLWLNLYALFLLFIVFDILFITFILLS